MATKQEKQDFIDELRKQNGGILSASELLEASEPKDAPTHDCFEWKDSKAGHEYRLHQARQLLAVYVTIMDSPNGKVETRAYVSLSTERGDNGGYRAIADVLSDEDLRQQLLQDAFRDLEIFRKKYSVLTELAPVFSAQDKIAINHSKIPSKVMAGLGKDRTALNGQVSNR